MLHRLPRLKAVDGLLCQLNEETERAGLDAMHAGQSSSAKHNGFSLNVRGLHQRLGPGGARYV